MEIGRHTSRMMRKHGGMSVLDEINDGLLFLPFYHAHSLYASTSDEYPDTLEVAGYTLTKLSKGYDRVVYKWQDLVFKFPENNRDEDGTGYEGEKANIREWEVYNRVYKHKLHALFAPALALMDGWPYGRVLVMRYIEGAHGTIKESRVARLSIKLYSVANVDTVDTHVMNTRGGKFIDYGRFHLDGRRFTR